MTLTASGSSSGLPAVPQIEGGTSLVAAGFVEVGRPAGPAAAAAEALVISGVSCGRLLSGITAVTSLLAESAVCCAFVTEAKTIGSADIVVMPVAPLAV